MAGGGGPDRVLGSPRQAFPSSSLWGRVHERGLGVAEGPVQRAAGAHFVDCWHSTATPGAASARLRPAPSLQSEMPAVLRRGRGSAGGRGELRLWGQSGFVSLSEGSHTQGQARCRLAGFSSRCPWDGHGQGELGKGRVLPLNLGLGVEGALGSAGTRGLIPVRRHLWQ